MSKSGNKGIKDPRLRAYHLLPPAQGPQVVCVSQCLSSRRPCALYGPSVSK